MLFKPEMCQAVLDGTKTMTRRLVKDREAAIHRAPGYAELPIEMVFSHGMSGRLKWAVGNTYAVQPGRGKKAVGRFLLAGIRREYLQDISAMDCLAEGIYMYREIWGWTYAYSGMEEPAFFSQPQFAFRTLWDSIHRKRGTCFEDNPKVWVLEVEGI